MRTSGDSDPGDKAQPKKPIITPPKHGHKEWPHQPLPGKQSQSGGRQAYTTHIPKHDRQHHRPGRG